jgi:glycosyltransferase involved in cell wall biosynthesis
VAQFPRHSAINPALDLFGAHLSRVGVQVLLHSILPGNPDQFAPWLAEQAAKLDVLHLHWYQRLYLRANRNDSAAALDRFVGALRLARREGITLTWTAHNLQPHERPFPLLDETAAAAVTDLVDGVFVECEEAVGELVAAYPRLVGRCTVVPSGSYRATYGDPVDHVQARAALGLPDRGRIFLAFGLIRRYKRVPELAVEFSRVFAGTDHLLLIAGEPHDTSERRRLLESVIDRPNVVARLEKVSDTEVATVFGAANHVVCNYVDNFNSGVLRLAATMGRGVIAAPTGTSRGVPSEALTPIRAGADGLASAMRAAAWSDWQEQGKAGMAWARQYTWYGAARAARAAWDGIRAQSGAVADFAPTHRAH